MGRVIKGARSSGEENAPPERRGVDGMVAFSAKRQSLSPLPITVKGR